MIDKFAVFILTHGRPDRVITYNTLRKQGYTGDIYIIIDNEDKTAGEYKKLFGDKAIIFDKLAIAKTFDTADNFNDRRSVVFARNACWDIARNLGIEYFLQLDDDYTEFRYKFGPSLKYRSNDRIVKNLNKLFGMFVDYYRSTKAITISFGQGGDFLGGESGGYAKTVSTRRKVMNSFFCSTARRFCFLGRVNEDVNTYTRLGNIGELMLSLLNIAIEQRTTQTNAGGMSELYQNEGTYIKSFYPVMYCPSSVRVSDLRSSNPRLHHRIEWKNTVPRIIEEKYKKE